MELRDHTHVAKVEPARAESNDHAKIGHVLSESKQHVLANCFAIIILSELRQRIADNVCFGFFAIAR